MSKHTVKGYITFKPAEFDFEQDRVGFVDFKPTGATGWGVLVREHTIEVELPDDFNPRAAQITALEEQREALRAQFAKSIRELDEQISKLQAIEYTPEAQ